MTKLVLGLGSNLGDREDNLNKAVKYLHELNIISDIKKSNIFKNKALLIEGSPESWDLEFYNIAVLGNTNLKPLEILSKIKSIEKLIGRNNVQKWSPRLIDIDILAYGNECYDIGELTIPHKKLLNRDFVLIPFNEIYPDWLYPLKGEYYNKSTKFLVKKLFNEEN